MSAAPALIVGTRGSRLAVAQTNSIIELLKSRHPRIEFTLKPISTRGDSVQDRSIAALGDKGVFVRPLEDALIDCEIDIAVHSLKDVPADVEIPQLKFAAFSSRADARDVVVSTHAIGLADLLSGSRVGTGSARRRVQLLDSRPDLRVLGIRGNVDTRLRKLDEGQFDAIILAAAGLQRLDLGSRITEYLPVDTFIPDAGQGILAVQTRLDSTHDVVQEIDDAGSRRCAQAERAVVQSLGAGCHSPVGAYAVMQNGALFLRAMAASEDGARIERISEVGEVSEPRRLGVSVGARLRDLLSH